MSSVLYHLFHNIQPIIFALINKLALISLTSSSPCLIPSYLYLVLLKTFFYSIINPSLSQHAFVHRLPVLHSKIEELCTLALDFIAVE